MVDRFEWDAKGPQSYHNPVKAGGSSVRERNLAGKTNRTAEELEAERK
jgi:hypothetical protein